MRVAPWLFALLLAVPIGLLPIAASAAWPTDPWTGVPLCTAAGNQFTGTNQAASDGAGGAYVAWTDYRGGADTYIYMTRVTSSGAISAGWPVNGIAVCAVTNYRQIEAVVPGTSGDVFVVWDDYRAGNYDVYAQRIASNGSIAAGWPVNGLALTTDARSQSASRACVDGAGGIYVAWTFQFSGSDYDIDATRVLPGGTIATGFAVNGVSVNSGTQYQSNPDIAADGLGNAIVTYENYDGTYTHPFVQKIGPAGATTIAYPGRDLAPVSGQSYFGTHVIAGLGGGAVVGFNINSAAATDGPVFTFLDAALATRFVSQPVATSGYDKFRAMVPDGAGGAFCYVEYDDPSFTNGYFYLDHISPSGAALPAWPGAYLYQENGTNQFALASGAEGTALVGWSRAGNTQDVQMQRMDAAGNLLWSSPYVAQIANDQSVGSIVPDATGGAIVSYEDARNGVSNDIYAVKIDRFGYLGDAAPAITKISDVPKDNGGQVSLQWSPSYKDVGPDYGIARYSVWRRVPGGTLAARMQRGARTIGMADAHLGDTTGVIRLEKYGVQVIGWEYVAGYPARGYPAYSAVVPTISDSLGSGNPRTSFRVQAETTAGIPFWDSAPDSGYSVDNLPPVAPVPFTGAYSAGSATLAWQPNAETDMGTYRLYRGGAAFVPSPANLVVEQSTTGYVDVAGGPYWYKLSAVDMHGNESPFTTLLPSGTTDAGASLPRELSFSRPAPNPTRDHVDLRFALPRAAEVQLEVFDTSGRRVKTVIAGHWSPGAFSARWDGRDESGVTVGPGLYFVRFTAEGHRFQERVTLLR